MRNCMTLVDDFGRIVRVFVNQSEAAKGIPSDDDERILYAETLAFKIVQHAVSSLVLFRGTAMDDFGFHTTYQDAFSVLGLTRMCHESYLLFNHVFVTPQTPEDHKFRLLAWRYVDKRRQSQFSVSDPEIQARRVEIQSSADELQTKLESNSVFCELDQKSQNRILKRLKWPFLSWSSLGKEAGFNNQHATQVYRYLSSYAHPGSLSIEQMRYAAGEKMLQNLAETGLKHAAIILACLILDFAKIFDSARPVLDVDNEGRQLVTWYADLARLEY